MTEYEKMLNVFEFACHNQILKMNCQNMKPEHREALDEVERMQSELAATVGHKGLDRLMSAHDHVSSYDTDHFYKHGFADGVKFMMDLLHYGR